MRAAVDAAIDGIKADCGGVMTCATCHVYVDARVARPPAAAIRRRGRNARDDGGAARPTSRLSCQIALAAEFDGLTATLPATQY